METGIFSLLYICGGIRESLLSGMLSGRLPGWVCVGWLRALVFALSALGPSPTGLEVLLQCRPLPMLECMLERNLWHQSWFVFHAEHEKHCGEKPQLGETWRLEFGGHHLQCRKRKLSGDGGCGTGAGLSTVFVLDFRASLLCGSNIHRLCLPQECKSLLLALSLGS